MAKGKYLSANHYCIKHSKHKATGEIYWHPKQVEYFAKTYCGLNNIHDSDRESIKYTMYTLFEKQDIYYTVKGLPIYDYLNKPNPVIVHWLK
jgi:hypothetical protein